MKNKAKHLLFLWLFSPFIFAQNVQFSQSKKQVETHDFVEILLRLNKAVSVNPFTDVTIRGEFKTPDNQTITIKGFCDSPDGRLSKVRFMPTQAGTHSYLISYEKEGKKQIFRGTFLATKSNRKGMVRVDKQHPWHFVWDGTGEHYFYFGTTTYWLLGWKDETIIDQAIDRLADYKVNRIRVAINGRSEGGQRWSEPLVQESKNFTYLLNPWVATKPNDLDNPGFDVTRFNVSHWQKLDRLLARARERNVVVSVIFYVDGLDHGCDPFKKTNMGNEDEKRYYTYAAARYAAYSNVMWDITNEYHLFRSEEWADKMGAFMKNQDPYHHLMSIHGHGDFPFRKANWVDFVMFQQWDQCSDYAQMLKYRQMQEASGELKPQVNEEYGYEGHYPLWGCGSTKVAPNRAAENRADLAWQMYMAGCYQTTGERADEGTGAGNDAGGGWINGRGNDKMVMFKLYDVIYDTFTGLQWWKMNPKPELVNNGNLCLAEIGKQYLIYSQQSEVKLKLDAGVYQATIISPRTGEQFPLKDVTGGQEWIYPQKEGLKADQKLAQLEGKWVIKLIKK